MSEHLEQLPSEILEQRAQEQRKRIGKSVSELKLSLQEEVRERLDVNHFVREHRLALASVGSMVAFTFGYAITGIFTRS